MDYLRQNLHYSQAGKTFGDNRGAAGKKVRVSVPSADGIETAYKVRPTDVLQPVLKKRLSSSPKSDDQLQTAQAGSDSRTGGYQSSARIERLAKPLERLQKPLIRLRSVNRETNHRVPWSAKGPGVSNEKTKVFHSSMQPAWIQTGVSRAALKYEASDNIKRLAEHRPKPKVDNEKKQFSVKPMSLTYKPSLRIQELSKPRIRVVKT